MTPAHRVFGVGNVISGKRTYSTATDAVSATTSATATIQIVMRVGMRFLPLASAAPSCSLVRLEQIVEVALVIETDRLELVATAARGDAQ